MEVSIMTVYGYARVSTDGQTLDNQVAQLRAAGAENVFSEKVSGAKADNRKALRKALQALGDGDMLLVTRLDRLARSTRDLLNVISGIGDNGATFKSLAEPWADTSSAAGTLFLQILGSIAEFERKLIKTRCDEGRVRAMANGIKFGPKYKLTPHQKQEALKRKENGETLVEIARSYNVSHQTIMRL
jgi:DNA invertase Pin-like site-specific DNA recombinase